MKQCWHITPHRMAPGSSSGTETRIRSKAACSRFSGASQTVQKSLKIESAVLVPSRGGGHVKKDFLNLNYFCVNNHHSFSFKN